MDCDIAEGRVRRQVLAVCRVGDFCTVGAKGESGNGNRYLIQKVFEVQRQPASRVQELKRDSQHDLVWSPLPRRLGRKYTQAL